MTAGNVRNETAGNGNVRKMTAVKGCLTDVWLRSVLYARPAADVGTTVLGGGRFEAEDRDPGGVMPSIFCSSRRSSCT